MKRQDIVFAKQIFDEDVYPEYIKKRQPIKNMAVKKE